MDDLVAFNITVTYFKLSGKFYAHATFVWKGKNCGTPEHPICYMDEVADYVQVLRDRGAKGELPGLSCAGWDGPILLDSDAGFPVLLLK